MLREYINELKNTFKDTEVKITKGSKGNDKHIRVQFITLKLFLASGFKVSGFSLDTRYSSTFITYFVEYKGETIPVVISDRKNVRGDNKILQKELTPVKLSIKGIYKSFESLYTDIINGLSNIKSSFEDGDVILFDLLISLTDNVAYDKELTEDEDALYSKNSASINKDFGESLAALRLLKDGIFSHIEFSSGESSKSYDIIGLTNSGIKKRVNIKSGNGSGQSFKSLSGQTFDLLSGDDFISNSDSYRYSEIIKLMSEAKVGKGKGLMLMAGSILMKGSDPIAFALKELSNCFFKTGDFNKDGLKKNISTFKEYKEIIKIINEKYLNKSVGIPLGTKDKKADDIFDDKMTKCLELSIIDAITFTISTWISNFTKNEIITEIMNDLIVNKIYTFYVRCVNKKLTFEEIPTKVKKYKFHYWACYDQPTRNLLGFKEL